MAKKNYSKEIAEFQKRIDELKLEEARESLSPALGIINDEILRNKEAVQALSRLTKDEVRVVSKLLATGVAEAVKQAEPDLQRIRDRKAKQNAARKAKREAIAVASEDISEDDNGTAYEDAEPQRPTYGSANQWNGQR